MSNELYDHSEHLKHREIEIQQPSLWVKIKNYFFPNYVDELNDFLIRSRERYVIEASVYDDKKICEKGPLPTPADLGYYE